ncbi:MAG: metallophosphoesterase [Elusimicrobia bacterium]|nr:metallophosphoesterase [Elusimicrobiota bacterium]
MTPETNGRTQVHAAPPKREALRVAAVGDLHCRAAPNEELRHLFAQAAQKADVLLLCGDLTDYGLPEEAKALTAVLGPAADLPVLAVLGNHDFESGKEAEVAKILSDAGVRILDGDGWEYRGVGFAGAKGFMGGFRARQLQAWGEAATKAWVKEATEEALKLERALARLRAPTKVAMLHYAPIPDTVAGEPLEIMPFLGSSRLEEPINQYGTSFVVHGHAHHGSAEGRTSKGVPVYNVALPLLRRSAPAKPLFRVVTLHPAEVGA